MASRPSLRALRRAASPIWNTPRARPFCASARQLNSSAQQEADRKTHFGFETINESEKAERVAGVFHSVAESYDNMNDLMSFGWHRIWKYVLPPLLSSLVASTDVED